MWYNIYVRRVNLFEYLFSKGSPKGGLFAMYNVEVHIMITKKAFAAKLREKHSVMYNYYVLGIMPSEICKGENRHV